MRLVRKLQDEGREATEAERDVLSGWTGWGALPHVFDPQSPQHRAVADGYAELQTLLTPAEIEAAKRSTLNAHYTDPRYVAAIWQAVQQLGFEKGRVLEPGCGSGNFISTAPEGARCVGVELEPSTAAIAQALYPQAQILAESFAETRLPENSIDVVVGNVPFGSITLHDKTHNAAGHSIHNHFLIKSAHLLHERGVMAVITSRYTLDSQNPAARRELAVLGDLLGAVRLPSGAHRGAAGTDVVTDVLLLRKRPAGQEPASEAFETSRKHELGVNLNEYFHAHPEDVLGTMSLGQAEGGRAELEVTGEGDITEKLQAALGRIVARAIERGQTYQPSAFASSEVKPIAAVARDARPYGYIELGADGDSFTIVEDRGPVELQVPQTQRAELRALLGLRDTAVALLEAEASTSDDTDEIVSLRSQLNRRYDAYKASYGPINRITLRRTGRVDPDTGDEKMARIRPPQGRFRLDPFSNVVYALEHFVESEGEAYKATIFKERVIARPAQRLGADTAEDALAISLDTVGEVDLPLVARLLGVGEDEARKQLGTLVFDEPHTGRIVHAAEYLSGNVRKKLAAAEEAAQLDTRLLVNVQALEEVIPPDLQPSEIQANLGAAWIAPRYVEQFLGEILEDRSVRVEQGYGSMWEVASNNKFGTLAISRWGTERFSAIDVAKSLLEQRPIRIVDIVDDVSVFNAEATIAATEKANEMAERFADWVWEDPQRAAELARIYNERFNAIVPRDYSRVKPSLPGLALQFSPREHQITAVAQSLHERTVGLFHEVGAGKTAVMIMGVMEKQRLGIVNKPVVVVPNHMLEQFAREWQQLYPQARLLAAGNDDLSRDRRRLFVARCATNHWDAVIMTRSAFERSPVSRKTEEAYLRKELSGLESALDEARESGQKRLTLKRMERIKARREERLKKLLDSSKDEGISFEQLGVDHVVVDEAHAYKNLTLVSAIPGAAIEGSQRASDLHQKLWYLREEKQVRNVGLLATATPIANSISEAYTMTRYLAPEVLEDAGIHAFDQWAATFGRTVTQLEVSPDGTSMRMHSRFARFHNVPELMRMWAPFANVQTAEDLKLPVPDLKARASDGQRAPEVVLVPPTESLLNFVDGIAQRAERVRSRMVTPDEDNMLSITNAGRAGALDLRLAGIEPDGPQKIDVAADRIAAIYEETKDRRYPGPDGSDHPNLGALQLVFSDLGTPKDDRFNVYDGLRDELAKRGVPPERVRFMHEAKTDRDKDALFTACREGQVSVLIGSTEKMGVGTNVQLRTVALHHLDCPWRPADIAQREGRILRQGNANSEVQILRYVTERSFDSYLWQTVARKAAFIGQVLKPRSDVRQLDGDISESALSYDEVKALATGNPLLLEHAQATADVRRLERLENSHNNNQAYLRRRVQGDRDQLAYLESNLEKLVAAQQQLTEEFALEVGATRYDEKGRAKGNEALRGVIQKAVADNTFKRGWSVTVGRFRGLPIAVSEGYGDQGCTVALSGMQFQLLHNELGHANVVQRLQNRVDEISNVAELDAARIKRLGVEIQRSERSIGEPFGKRTELDNARAQLRNINEALEASARPEHEVDPEQRMSELVEKEREAIAGRAGRAAKAIESRADALARKAAAHRVAKPKPGVLGMSGAQKEALARWEKQGVRLAGASARLDRHRKVVSDFLEPDVGMHPSKATQLANKRVRTAQPELAERAQEARAARLAAQRQVRSQERTARRSR